MSRFCGAFLLLGLILLQPLPIAASPTPTTAGFEAEVLEVNLDEQSTVARDNASFSYQALTLHADHLIANRLTGEVEASGNLELTQGGRRLRGESLQYNIHTEEGVLTKARVAEQGVFITGEKVVFSPAELVAHQAYFTTCDHPRPHYTFGAGTISLTAEETAPGEQPQSGRLTLDQARITYRNRRLFSLPRYSVSVGQLSEPEGMLQRRWSVGRYVRREDASDRELNPDDLEASLANVLLNRDPEYGARLPQFAVGRSLQVRAEWLAGSYTEWVPGEQEARASADRVASNVVLSLAPYPVSRKLRLSHAFGWRRATYSPGDWFTSRFYRHAADLDVSRKAHLSLAYIARRSSGETPFLFDEQGPGRELLADLTWQITSQWGLRLLDLYDIEDRQPRDMMFEVTRTAHCLAYTVGWRKSRGRFYVRIGLVPTGSDEMTP